MWSGGEVARGVPPVNHGKMRATLKVPGFDSRLRLMLLSNSRNALFDFKL